MHRSIPSSRAATFPPGRLRPGRARGGGVARGSPPADGPSGADVSGADAIGDPGDSPVRHDDEDAAGGGPVFRTPHPGDRLHPGDLGD
ncbi:hypothetical protein [Curtobacterium sp. MCPF17_052]|uniref:hypothetical protein n=1 Tax=Curtobacterium sp. MCPF17_052 TaxID=2175655 RepID=UPI0024E00B7A|nr:hypothetical protein [Curtobacterium sp. MCPF17_052]WIB13782.1 hypothetical protein DEJ36_09015 [Curtobacterium sp. MCPF17_052]